MDRTAKIKSLALVLMGFCQTGFAGLTFYTRFDAEARVACAVALTRILGHYQSPGFELALPSDSEAPDTQLGVMLAASSKDEARRRLGLFPSLASAKIDWEKESPAMLNLGPYFPDVVRDAEVVTRRGDANCLGGALAWFGHQYGGLFLDEVPFNAAVKAHFRKVARGQRLRPETLMVWRWPDSDRPIHAAVLLSDNVLWHRPGSNAGGFDLLAKAINRYGGRNGGDGDARIEFYRPKP